MARTISYPIKLDVLEDKVLARYGAYVGQNKAQVIRSLIHQLGLATLLLTEADVRKFEKVYHDPLRGSKKE